MQVSRTLTLATPPSLPLARYFVVEPSATRACRACSCVAQAVAAWVGLHRHPVSACLLTFSLNQRLLGEFSDRLHF